MHKTALQDFEFNQGEWIVEHRRLQERGKGSDTWNEFETRTHAQLLMGGSVSIDETDFAHSGFKGMTLRVYDPIQDRWAIYWINSTDGVLQPPVYGRFHEGLGIFEGDDLDGERPIKVRFEWDARSPATPRWSQAFSYDAGTNWEVNWIMNFRRP
ncbi:MAG: hypothetical protein K0R27_3461 [Xanthobacteraceae bacterium]|nr:hypothetical protein [Xanthobacteraceae bacterium]